MSLIRIVFALICFIPSLAAAREPVTHVILFGGEDGDDFKNQFYDDFVALARSFAPHTKLTVHYGGAKTQQLLVHPNWKRSNLETAIGLKAGTIKDATISELNKTLLEIYYTIQPQDQVLIAIETHGTCSKDSIGHLWSTSESSEKVTFSDPRQISVLLENIKKKQGKVAIIDGSCFGGESVEYFGDIACVVAHASRDLTACSRDFIKLWNRLAEKDSKRVPLSEIYIQMSQTIKDRVRCESQPVISGFTDRSDYWYEWLNQILEENQTNIPDFYKLYSDGGKVCERAQADDHVENWLKSLESQPGTPAYFKSRFLDRMKPYFSSKKESEKLFFDSLKASREFNQRINELQPILFKKSYPVMTTDFGDKKSQSVLKEIEASLKADFAPLSDLRPLVRPLGDPQVTRKVIRSAHHPLGVEFYEVSVPIQPSSKFFDDYWISHTRRKGNQSASENVRLSYKMLLVDIEEFIHESYSSELRSVLNKKKQTHQRLIEFNHGVGSYNQAVRQEARSLYSESESDFRRMLADIQVVEYQAHIKDLEWKEKHHSLSQAEKKQLEQINRCRDFKLDFGKR